MRSANPATYVSLTPPIKKGHLSWGWGWHRENRGNGNVQARKGFRPDDGGIGRLKLQGGNRDTKRKQKHSVSLIFESTGH